VSRKCGSLAVSKPYGTSQPITGTALLFFMKHFSVLIKILGFHSSSMPMLMDDRTMKMQVVLMM
jgi:hypothetical protein